MAINFGNWDAGIHDEFEQVKRMESGRKLAKKILQIDTEEGWVEIQGSAAEPYRATLDECECVDYAMRRLPCKHIYCLAFEMGKMDGLPEYEKRKSKYDAEAEIERFKAMHINGEIPVDTYAKIYAAIEKQSAKKKKKTESANVDVDAEIERYKEFYISGNISAEAYVAICDAIAKLKK